MEPQDQQDPVWGPPEPWANADGCGCRRGTGNDVRWNRPGAEAFRSNGDQIYHTAKGKRGTAISYTGGLAPSGGMMGNGQLACVSCHGSDGRGGVHSKSMNQAMDAKDIRWSVLQGEFDLDKFRLAVVKGQDPDGTQLNADMARWTISDDDLADLIVYLKTLP